MAEMFCSLARLYCTPTSDAGKTTLLTFKQTVNRAADTIGLDARYRLATTNPNIDENTYNLVVMVARALPQPPTRDALQPDLPENLLLDLSEQPTFKLFVDKFEQVDVAMARVARGDFGKRTLTQGSAEPASGSRGLILVSLAGVAVIGGLFAIVLRSRRHHVEVNP